MQTNVSDCACAVNQVWGWSGPVWWLWRFRWPQRNWPMLFRLSFCLFQTLPMLHHSLCMHGKRAVPGSVEIPVVDRCGGLGFLWMSCQIQIQPIALSDPARESDRWLELPHHVHCPQVCLSVSLLSSMVQMEHHPCVSFLLVAWRQSC